jgi:hypothetical protein
MIHPFRKKRFAGGAATAQFHQGDVPFDQGAEGMVYEPTQNNPIYKASGPSIRNARQMFVTSAVPTYWQSGALPLTTQWGYPTGSYVAQPLTNNPFTTPPDSMYS